MPSAPVFTELHNALTGNELHEAFHYVQSTDPGQVGINIYWLDTSVSPYVLKRRDPTDTFWVVVGSGTTTGTLTVDQQTIEFLTGVTHLDFSQSFALNQNGTKVEVSPVFGTSPGQSAEGDHEHIMKYVESMTVVLDGGGGTITPGVVKDIWFNHDATLIGWKLFADVSGNVTLDVQKAIYANFSSISAVNSIVGTSAPILAGTDKASDIVLNGWTTAITSGEVVRVYLDAGDTVRTVTLALELQRLV